MSPSSRVLVCAALLAATSSPAAPKRPAAGAPLTPRFGWPPGLRLQVEERHSVRMVEGAAPTEFTLRYPLALEERGQERWLVPGPAEVSPANMRAFLGQRPTQVLGPQGDLLRAEVPEALLEMMLEVNVAMSDSAVTDEQRQKLREHLGQQMQEGARKQWEELVGAWRGRTLTPGTVERRKTTLPSQFQDAGPVEAEERLSVEGPLPCAPGAATRCVRIRRETVADAATLARQARAYEASFNKGLRKGVAPLRVQEVEAHTSLELLTEPDTLVPHRLREEEVFWRVSSELGEKPSGSGQRKVRELTFTPAPPAP